MKKKLIILNIVFISICGILIVNDFYYILRDGAISIDGRVSLSMIHFVVKFILFSMGIILLNIAIIKNKLILGISIMLIFIIIGIIGANLTYAKYNEVTSDSDWFSDGIN
ncbi:MAG: hypothetical protein ACK5HR_03125 [Mycoplasmatales bacterium]